MSERSVSVSLFSLFNSSQRKKSVKGQPEKMSLEACWKLTATDGRGEKVMKRQ